MDLRQLYTQPFSTSVHYCFFIVQSSVNTKQYVAELGPLFIYFLLILSEDFLIFQKWHWVSGENRKFKKTFKIS